MKVNQRLLFINNSINLQQIILHNYIRQHLFIIFEICQLMFKLYVPHKYLCDIHQISL